MHACGFGHRELPTYTKRPSPQKHLPESRRCQSMPTHTAPHCHERKVENAENYQRAGAGPCAGSCHQAGENVAGQQASCPPSLLSCDRLPSVQALQHLQQAHAVVKFGPVLLCSEAPDSSQRTGSSHTCTHTPRLQTWLWGFEVCWHVSSRPSGKAATLPAACRCLQHQTPAGFPFALSQHSSTFREG